MSPPVVLPPMPAPPALPDMRTWTKDQVVTFATMLHGQLTDLTKMTSDFLADMHTRVDALETKNKLETAAVLNVARSVLTKLGIPIPPDLEDKAYG